ncbi:DMT family transporter, partial [Mitsuokella jalaludinii]|uniref:DMT family transporter n=1 Tax=Mitsuokella jalaludinii TaxID=187979 RepID=UPI002A90DB17
MPTAKNSASSTPPARRRGILLALTGAVLWGGSGVAGQYVLQDCAFSTEWLVGVRLILSGALLLLIDFAAYRQDLLTVFRERRDCLETIAFAVLGMLGVQYTYFATIKFSNAATGTILQYLMPVVIVAWTALHTRRRPPAGELFCVALAVLGTFLLVTHG